MTSNLADLLLQGNRRALARAITAVETGGPLARELVAAAYRHTGRAHVIGITGAPGAGKSTLVNALALHWRAQGQLVGIIAVDPSSPFSGGAILGDRIRMQPLGGDAGVFIRSMASRGRLGGIARATGDAVTLLDAAGFALVVVETVGAGQSEVEVAGAAHTTVVVEAPGMGDDVQSIKAGMLEIANVVVVNKSDRPEAASTLRQLRAALQLGGAPADGWHVPVLAVAATRSEGVPELASAIAEHRAYVRSSAWLLQIEEARAAYALRGIVQEAALQQALEREHGSVWEAQVRRVARREVDPYTAAGMLLKRT
jgi:LAO/AO transport system kinase